MCVSEGRAAKVKVIYIKAQWHPSVAMGADMYSSGLLSGRPNHLSNVVGRTRVMVHDSPRYVGCNVSLAALFTEGSCSGTVHISIIEATASEVSLAYGVPYVMSPTPSQPMVCLLAPERVLRALSSLSSSRLS